MNCTMKRSTSIHCIQFLKNKGEMNIKRIMKIMLTIGMFIAFLSTVPVKAEYNETENDPTEYVVFDLDGGDQSETIYDENGNPIVISMTSLDGKQKSITNGNKLISADTLFLSASFVVTVSNQRFTAVSNGKYTAWGVTIKNAALRLNSSTLATYALNCSALGVNYIKTLSARLSNSEIVISFD